MPSFYSFTTFTSEVKLLWHMYKYALKHPFRQDIFKQMYRNVIFRYHILTLALYTLQSTYASLNTSGKTFFKADYCLKHFKLVFFVIIDAST